jgi:hypothetical protein
VAIAGFGLYLLFPRFLFLNLGISGVYTTIFAAFGVERNFQPFIFVALFFLFYIIYKFLLKGKLKEELEEK